ncbi:MAG: RnfABCDGE type electron transport complex subunit G [Elusimicrobia bacterium]|nr:RnfABCDGE type electron transport complex subunit G [Candidatus Liberimonas magnetica]
MKIFKSGLILLILSVVSGASLSFVYRQTEGLIKDAKAKKLYDMEKELLPDARSFKEIEDGSVVLGFNAEGRKAGVIVLSSYKGYGGMIDILAGIDEQDRVTKVKVLKHTETPGLGNRVERDDFLSQFTGKNLAAIFLKKDNPNGEIEAVTGATVSSRAIVESVKKALAKSSNYEEKIEVKEE